MAVQQAQCGAAYVSGRWHLLSLLGRLLTPPLTVEGAQLLLGHNAETQ